MIARRGLLALFLLCLGAAPGVMGAAEGDPNALPTPGIDIREMIGEPAGPPLSGEALIVVLDEVTALMRCPVCQGLSVADSPVASALAIREEVRKLLQQGYTEEQIFDYFEGAYGEFIRLSPRARGFNLVVWIAPIVMVLVGLLLVGKRLRRREAPADAAELADDLAPYRERVRREVGYSRGGA